MYLELLYRIVKYIMIGTLTLNCIKQNNHYYMYYFNIKGHTPLI